MHVSIKTHTSSLQHRLISLVMTSMTSWWCRQRLLGILWNRFTCFSCVKWWTAPLKWQHSKGSQLCRAEHTVVPHPPHTSTPLWRYTFTPLEGSTIIPSPLSAVCVSLSLPNSSLSPYKRPHNLTWPTLLLTVKAIREQLDWFSGQCTSSSPPHWQTCHAGPRWNKVDF